MQDRLQKILARAGIASRRSAEQLIEAGRVRVNGKTITELGSRADPRTDRIEVDGKRIIAENPVYILLHKPRAVMATLKDPEGRPTVADIVKELPLRVFPVGRLDYQTSGALLLTNDGDFTAQLLHPRHHVPKTYLVKVKGDMGRDDLAKWRDGVLLEDGPTLATEVIVTKREGGHTWFELIMREGRNQQIRRMGEATGFPVIRLTRTAFAGMTIDGLRAGQWRFLTTPELRDLKAMYGVPKHLRAVASTHTQFARLQPTLGRTAPRAIRAPKKHDRHDHESHETDQTRRPSKAKTIPTKVESRNTKRKAEHKAEHKVEHKVEHKAERKAEHKAEHKAERKAEHKAGRKAEHDGRKQSPRGTAGKSTGRTRVESKPNTKQVGRKQPSRPRRPARKNSP